MMILSDIKGDRLNQLEQRTSKTKKAVGVMTGKMHRSLSQWPNMAGEMKITDLRSEIQHRRL